MLHYMMKGISALQLTKLFKIFYLMNVLISHFSLSSCSLKKLNLALWGDLASYHFYSLTSNVGRVLLTTSIVVKEYNGNIYLSTSFATKIIMNPNIPEATSLLKWNEGHSGDSMNNRILLEDLVSIVENGVTEH
eukprot:TRINITY_DN5290_c0_g1_i7.p1 TRINITY_DN5290_c0_g1~~TRINITY_DN5290_c0_g1_i7.p1  ORF type:complete len:134 (+),score=6.30 TRINITY_DN5290_c0_g1_i7:637-1038(+)